MAEDTAPADAPTLLSEAELRSMYPRLRRFAAVVAPMEVGPDDLLQDALERVMSAERSEVTNPEGYLLRVLVNTASNHRRSLGRLRRHRERLGRLTASSEARDQYPSDVAFLELVSPTDRAVLFLHHVDGLPFQEVAARLDLSEASVKQIAVRARRRLRSHLEESS